MSDIKTDESNVCRRVMCRQPNKPDWNGWTLGEADGVWLAVRPDSASKKRVMVHAFHVHPEAQTQAGQDEVSFTVRVPPTTNHWWKPIIVRGVPMLVKTKEAKEWKSETQRLLSLQRIVPFTGKVQVYVDFYQSAGRGPNRDSDNILKGLFDAMTGLVFADDRQIGLHTVRIHEPDFTGQTKAAKELRAQWRARVEVTISAMNEAR